MAILVASFDPSTASVLLTIDGTTWGTVPATVTATRTLPDGDPEKVRGIIGKTVAGGYLVATDHEMPLNASVQYTVTGYNPAGASVGTAIATVSTAVTATGLWLKAPGRPDLTVFAQPRLGEVSSPTIGGVYQVVGGDAVAIAQWSGLGALSAGLTVRTDRGAATDQLRALLAAARVLLVQPVGWTDLEAGWYFASGAAWSNPGGFEDFAFRLCSLPLQRVGVPAGQSGGAQWTWAAVKAQYATWADFKAAHGSWFLAQQGSS